MPLVTLEEARFHLRVDDEFTDEMLEGKIQDASDILLDYLKIPSELNYWTAEIDSLDESFIVRTPGSIRAATLLILGALFDDHEGGDPISKAVQDLVIRFRDPSLA